MGKSTAAFHLAYYFSSLGKVVLVDADPNRSSTHWAERSPSPVPFNVVGLEDTDKVKAEFLLLDSQITDREITSIAQESDVIIIPSTISALSVEAGMILADHFQQLKADYRILLNMVDPRARRTATKAAESLQEMGYALLSTQVRGYSVYEQAALKGLPVNKVPGKFSGIAWGDYKALGEEIMGVLNV